MTTLFSVLTAFILGIFLFLLIYIVAILPHFFYSVHFPKLSALPFIFPSLYTFVHHIIIGTSLSTFATPANGLLDYDPIRQLSYFFGLASITFIVSYISTIAAIVYTSMYVDGTKVHIEVNGVAKMSLCAIVFIITICAYMSVSERFYQRNISFLVDQARFVDMSCIASHDIVNGTKEWFMLWETTRHRLESGDSVVLWSEESVTVTSNEVYHNKVYFFYNIL